MLDFLEVSKRSAKRGVTEVYPKFMVSSTKDLMIRGGDFYAIWDEDRKLWSTDENDAIRLIDNELYAYRDRMTQGEDYIRVMSLKDGDTKMINKFHSYMRDQMRDNWVPLDEKIIFSNTETTKKDYRSKKLPYPLGKGNYNRYEELISTLYSPEERRKIEWRIGSIVVGDSVNIQKFIVLYGSRGTGKSTILNIIQDLFDGYYSVFDRKALGNRNSQFALEAFRTNPLVAIQHDGDLSRIEDNTRLNSVVSHELMTVNEKFKSTYTSRFKCFLFMGTNRPVKITDAKSGILRRLIDVSPTGKTLPIGRYRELVKQIKFELGPIAEHCKEVYLEDPGYYDDYVPVSMMGASNDFYNYVLDNYDVFKNADETTLDEAWALYGLYCESANAFKMTRRLFKEELKNYFEEFSERKEFADGSYKRNYYSSFKEEKFNYEIGANLKPHPKDILWVELKEQESIFDKEFKDQPAQYANEKEQPTMTWANVKTTLSDIDTKQLHYVKLPENHIVIDFDIPDESGEKNLELNLKAAQTFPKTYAELSKSGKALHLHYIYEGDVDKLSRVYADNIEIKVFKGNASLRRKLSLCNDVPIAIISSGLPTKGEQKVIDFTSIKTERAIRNRISKCLQKDYSGMPSTKQNVMYIYDMLEALYDSDISYDVSDMQASIRKFANNSTNNRAYCLDLVDKMKFVSKNPPEYNKVEVSDEQSLAEALRNLIILDVEVFPNFFGVCWHKFGSNTPVNKMKNPTKEEIEGLLKFKFGGFNNRKYDNHILRARLLGHNNYQLYLRSKAIIDGVTSAFIPWAYDLSYLDVYDIVSKKQSLKRYEVELGGVTHDELGLDWNEDVPEELWDRVLEYCSYDVLATEEVLKRRMSDFIAREILADVSGLKINDTTNSHTTRIIFGDNKTPQSEFNYRNMGDESQIYYICRWDDSGQLITCSLNSLKDDDYACFDKDGKPIFRGYKFDHGVSTYRGEVIGEGGYVYSEPGIYEDVAVLDVRSEHPHSLIDEVLFGDEYTQRFKDLVDIRIRIKHKDFDKAKTMLGGSLAKYLDDESRAKDLSGALKIAINSVYGLTSARFTNPFKDPRNVDNIVAKRGALFMVNLKHEVQNRGFKAVHIKTDSIKIPNATPEIIQFVMDYGKQYGYTFEHESTYDRMCLVNDAVYIAKYADGPHDFELPSGEKISTEWTRTGTQFQVPYVFKTLFSHSPIIFRDMCEIKTVQTKIYLDMNEDLPEGEHNYVFVGKVGLFTPIQPGHGGGVLYREAGGKYYSVTGTKGFRWLESEMVKTMNLEDFIDKNYYIRLVDEAVKSISEYGNFEEFTD